jgi:hypothetical protein
MTEDPLILSGSAARRLKLLLGHGVELTPGLRGVCERLAGSGLALAEGGAAGGGRNVLRAALLPRPVHWDEGAAAGGDADRDVHGELAASLATLKAFKVSMPLCSVFYLIMIAASRPGGQHAPPALSLRS